MGFAVRTNGGFGITFENGVTASIFIGFGSYTENHDDRSLLNHDKFIMKAPSGEIAALNKEGKMISYNIDKELFYCDDVAGFQSAEEYLAFLIKCRDYDGPMDPIKREDKDF